MSEHKLGLLVGGGPAPGINGVIAAATIHADLMGTPVVGIRDGFTWIMTGDTSHVEALTEAGVRAAHYRGGSILGTGRANPTRRPEQLRAALGSIVALGIDKLITIGGDDTAFSAMRLAETARPLGVTLGVVHVPKTIDNDLDLPAFADTFGFASARHLGTELAINLLADAATMSRWFFAIAMGRKAGHLALGVGAAADASITVIAEEWPEGPIPLSEVVDALAGAILKRRALGLRHGLAVIAEGIFERIDPGELAAVAAVGRDEHGNLRLADIDIGRILKERVRAALAELGIAVTIVTKEIGYELRCQDPGAQDLLYSRELGYCAARFILEGGTDAMVSIQSGAFVPIPFAELADPETGRARVRYVDTDSLLYRMARRYQTRLTADDLAEPAVLARLAEAAGTTTQAVRDRFAATTSRTGASRTAP